MATLGRRRLSRALACCATVGVLCAGVAAAASAGAKHDANAKHDTATAACSKMTHVRLVLQWLAQAQFAGYYAAKDNGYYAKQCLDVSIQQGGVNIVPQQVLTSGNADFAISQVPKSIATREQGADLVDISQVFQRGAFLQVSWKDSNITTLQSLKGTRVGSWGFGNDDVLRAAMAAKGVDPTKDVTWVQQPFDMSLLLKHEVDSAQAKIYNEYAQLLETTNPATGKLYQPSDFNILNLQKLGFTSYEDGIWSRGSWLKNPRNAQTAVKFIAASLQGWAFCRDNLNACVNIVLKNGSALGKGHQTWMLNEINKLIWPSPAGVGMVVGKAWNSTVNISLEGKIFPKKPDAGAYRNDLNAKALKLLRAAHVDVYGRHYKPQTVTLTPGGK